MVDQQSFPKLKPTKFSLNSKMHLLKTLDKLTPATNPSKSPIRFVMSNISYYDRNDIHLPSEGYDIMRKKIMDPNNHGYCQSQGLLPARKALAKAFSESNMTLSPDDVFITNGSGVALFYIMLSFCNQGDNILMPDIGFPFFLNAAKIYNVQIKIYRLKSEADWEIDLDDLQSKIDEKSKFILVINPSNPLGSVFSKKHCMDLLNVARKNKLAIVSDEIYWNMTYPKEEFYSLGHLTDDVPVVCLGGMEKIYLTPGWAIGWLLFYDKNGVLNEVKNGMGNVAQIFLHPTNFIQAAIPEIIELVKPDFSKKSIMPLFEVNKNRIMKEFENMKGYKAVKPKGSPNLGVFINLKMFKNIRDDIEFCQKLIDEQNITLFPMSGFLAENEEAKKENFQGFRILTCANSEYYDDFFKRLREFSEKNYI